MIRAALLGCIACAVLLGTQFVTHRFVQARADKPSIQSAHLELKKTKELNVPKIKDGKIDGYVVVQINYTINPDALKESGLSPDAIVSDEVFQYLFDDRDIDFSHLETVDLRQMFATLLKRINGRMNADVVRDMGVQEFTYMPASEAHRQP